MSDILARIFQVLPQESQKEIYESLVKSDKSKFHPLLSSELKKHFPVPRDDNNNYEESLSLPDESVAPNLPAIKIDDKILSPIPDDEVISPFNALKSPLNVSKHKHQSSFFKDNHHSESSETSSDSMLESESQKDDFETHAADTAMVYEIADKVFIQEPHLLLRHLNSPEYKKARLQSIRGTIFAVLAKRNSHRPPSPTPTTKKSRSQKNFKVFAVTDPFRRLFGLPKNQKYSKNHLVTIVWRYLKTNDCIDTNNRKVDLSKCPSEFTALIGKPKFHLSHPDRINEMGIDSLNVRRYLPPFIIESEFEILDRETYKKIKF